MINLRLAYNSTSVGKPIKGALKISKILKEQYGLVHSVDFNWTFAHNERNLIISFNDKHESISTIIGLQFMGRDLNEI